MFTDPDRKTSATIAKDSGEYTIAGPFQLVQGGEGALLFDPVYVKGENGQEEFWGFTILVIDWEKFIDEVEHLIIIRYGKRILSQVKSSRLRNARNRCWIMLWKSHVRFRMIPGILKSARKKDGIPNHRFGWTGCWVHSLRSWSRYCTGSVECGVIKRRVTQKKSRSRQRKRRRQTQRRQDSFHGWAMI